MKPVVWFTPIIPVSFGPKQYFGLPGLILELEEAAVIFKAKEITLNPKDKIVFDTIKGIKITKEAYSEFYKN
ncbi:GLPGLI family protein [Polaribacter sp. DS7-9]|nr:GLPGLI family protein [Polaribacter sp. DS7-9]MCG1035146.1 GLPGLI family protein [Polaribacter sp. DS7-9]